MLAERNIIELASGKLDDIVRAISGRKNFSENNVCVQVCSAIDLKTIPANSIDYVFTDPPFGDNLMYSELNFIWESWLKVHTNNHSEAIINSVQSKKISDYYALMHLSFKEYYRILKPKRWITVEFHNSKSSVWNTIQEALSKAGF
ncbi:MAG: site-specific DNA-methyltransferase [Bacteroidetes bacterium]|nr:site-specific DNA-methyltransferase [Bacteroidota bacterium]